MFLYKGVPGVVTFAATCPRPSPGELASLAIPLEEYLKNHAHCSASISAAKLAGCGRRPLLRAAKYRNNLPRPRPVPAALVARSCAADRPRPSFE